MFFEDNLNRRNGSELINDTTSHQFEMNPNQMFHPKLAIVIDTNILVSNLKFVQDMKDKPFDGKLLILLYFKSFISFIF